MGSYVLKLENRGIDTRSPVSLSDRRLSRQALLSGGKPAWERGEHLILLTTKQ
ncbi:hypothetical protein CA85_06750 [Allorhodopirellula solitaria]|uniref:Uncharacterized protein n=1 Tax=Allorhodopirellula solitaria TaxID=2527987 RepID=A0A5C5YKH7_9BACT|nr:hypothetical protein CA85_06750 [Allorhodopirellula solitaria]